nr:hypothetical protein XfCFBP8356_04000 [Xylella fastidiosa subsp. sandyi]
MFGDVSHLKTQGKYNDGKIQKDQGNISPAMALRNLTLLPVINHTHGSLSHCNQRTHRSSLADCRKCFGNHFT